MGDEIVYFSFQAVDDLLVPQVDITIPLKHLENLPEALLSKRYAWDKEHAMNTNDGVNATQPILVHPSQDPYKENWCHDMVHLIADGYEFFFNKAENERTGTVPPNPPLKLKLPAGMEAQVALMVLDYYGLNVKDPRSDISLEKSNDLIQIRAALFFEQMELMHRVKDSIFEKLKSSPRRINYFVHAYPEDDMDIINKLQITPNEPAVFYKLGENEKFLDFKEVLQEESMRSNLIEVLGEVGLKAKFISRDFSFPLRLQGFPGWAPNTKKAMCFMPVMTARPGSEEDYYGIRYALRARHVLRVEIPGGS